MASLFICLSLLFLERSRRPVWHTDVWGHLSYGRYIWKTGGLPATEPLLPYSHDIPFVDGPWLSQLIGYAVFTASRGQYAGLQGLYACGITLAAALVGWRMYRLTNHGGFGLLAIGLFLIIGGGSLGLLRPQIAGLVCFIFVFTRLLRPRLEVFDWIAIPLTFLLWANLHPSFVVGLCLMAAFAVGRGADLVLRTRSVMRFARSHRGVHLASLVVLATSATLVNPYGLSLYREVMQFSANPNLRDLTEWQAMSIRDGQGQVFAAASIALGILLRYSPRRVRCWELFAGIGLGLAALWSVRMLIWWAPVMAVLLTRHSFAVWSKYRTKTLSGPGAGPSLLWTGMAAAVGLVSFLLSPPGDALVFGRHQPVSRSVSSFTPLFASQQLRKHPPEGLVFAIYEWSDFLLWDGPPGIQLVVNSHAHLIPREIWSAYTQITELQGDWQATLDRLAVNVLVLDRTNRQRLIESLSANDDWEQPPVEQSGQVLFYRKSPKSIGGTP